MTGAREWPTMLHIKIIAPNRILYEGDARSITVPGYNGQLQALPQHAPYVALLSEGEIIVDSDASGQKRFSLAETGILRIDQDQVTVLFN